MQIQNRIRQRLAEGETLTGMILFTGSPMMIELMAAAEVDFVIIDMEQSALDLDRAAHCIRAADACGVTPFVRVPEVDAPLIKHLLNLGSAGMRCRMRTATTRRSATSSTSSMDATSRSAGFSLSSTAPMQTSSSTRCGG